MPALRASPVILARSVKKQAIAIFATVYSFRINHPLDLSSKWIISHLILYVNTFSYDFCFDSIISDHKKQFLSRASLLSSSRSRVRSSVRLQKRIYFTNFFGKTVLIDGLSSPYLNRLIISVFPRHIFVFTNFFGKIDFGIFRRSFCLFVANIFSINLFSLICPVKLFLPRLLLPIFLVKLLYGRIKFQNES